jgi:small conductance mechanosensitive channel
MDAEKHISDLSSRKIIMEDNIQNLDFFHKVHLPDVLLITGIVVCFWLLASLARWLLKHLAEIVAPSLRLKILRIIPWVRFGIAIAALSKITPILIEPSFQNVATLLVSFGVVIAFVFKDYASSVVAGFLAVAEDIYQLGDWVEIDGAYGEVILINPRAVHLLTSEDDEIIVPNYQLWTKKLANSTSGNRHMMCVANFYIHPDHDGFSVLRCLTEIGHSSSYRAPESKVTVSAQEKPWGTHYKLKAYVKESREQFTFITDLTVRGKQAFQEMKIPFALATPALPMEKS